MTRRRHPGTATPAPAADPGTRVKSGLAGRAESR